MINLSFMERIKTIFEVIKNNSLTVYLIPGIILFMIALIILACKSSKVTKIILSIFYVGIVGFMLYFFRNPILNFMDYLVEVIVNNILFPNIAVYTSTLIIVDLALIIALLSDKISKFVKTMNIICFTLMQFLLFFIVSNVIQNNIDVYEMLNVYTNSELLVLVETSMIIFAIWVLFLGLNKLAKVLSRKDKEKIFKHRHQVVLDYNEIMQENAFG